MHDPSEEQNPLLRRLAKRGQLTNSHRRSRKQEQSLTQRVKGMQVAGSGAGDVKGDVRRKRLLRIEAKTTKNKSFSVTLDMIHKIEQAGAAGAELPAIVVEFTDGFGRVLGEVAVVPIYVLDEICERHDAKQQK